MAKRFIDTGIFDDSWFMELSKDGKILWLYLITKCDHAGIIDFNEKLCKVQTGIENLEKALKELGNRCLTVRERYRFIPKFIMYQYPNFPNSAVRGQLSAIERLQSFGLMDDSLNFQYDENISSEETVIEQLDNRIPTVKKPLPNSLNKVFKPLDNTYEYDNVYIDNNIKVDNKESKEKEFKEKEKNWRNDFEIYKQELRDNFKKIMEDDDFIRQQSRLNPGVDVKLSMEKSCVNFWSTEAGWKHKKDSRAKTLDWKQTLSNAITLNSNKVYIGKNGTHQKFSTRTEQTRTQIAEAAADLAERLG